MFYFRPDGIAVYNCATGMQNPISWKEFVDYSFVFMRKHPLGDLVWYPDGQIHTNWIYNKFCVMALHVLPAYILDGVSMVLGKKRM